MAEPTADGPLFVILALIELTAADVADTIDIEGVHRRLVDVGRVVTAKATGGLASAAGPIACHRSPQRVWARTSAGLGKASGAKAESFVTRGYLRPS
jgi:hypothetical protein